MDYPKNSWRDDIILACKGWYGGANDISRLELIKAVQAFHCGVDAKHIHDKDVMFVIIRETYDLVFKNPRRDPERLLTELIFDADANRFGNIYHDDRPYWERMVDSFCSQIANLQVRDGDEIFISLPKIDPALKLELIHHFGETCDQDFAN